MKSGPEQLAQVSDVLGSISCVGTGEGKIQSWIHKTGGFTRQGPQCFRTEGRVGSEGADKGTII